MARPSSYNPELAASILERLAAGESLRSICRDEGMPKRDTVVAWAERDKEFAGQYARARDEGLEAIAEEIFEISDDGSNDWMARETRNGGLITVADQEHISRSKLRVDTRKWYLSKLAPKRYGDRLDLNVKGEITVVDRILAARKRAGG